MVRQPRGRRAPKIRTHGLHQRVGEVNGDGKFSALVSSKETDVASYLATMEDTTERAKLSLRMVVVSAWVWFQTAGYKAPTDSTTTTLEFPTLDVVFPTKEALVLSAVKQT